VGIVRVLAMLGVIVATWACAEAAGAEQLARGESRGATSPAASSTLIPNVDELSSIACAGSSTTCLALGGDADGNEVVVVLDSGVPGKEVMLPGGFGGESVACSSSTACVIVGYIQSDADTGGVLTVAVSDGAVTLGAVQSVANTSGLTDVACPPSATNACVAVGTGASTAVAVALPDGGSSTPGTPQDLPETGIDGDVQVSCSSTTQCLAVDEYGNSVVMPVSLSDGAPGTTQVISDDLYSVGGVSCVSGAGTAICELVGQADDADGDLFDAAEELTGVTGTTSGTQQTVETTPPDAGAREDLDGVSCPSISYCVGVGYGPNYAYGTAVAFTPNGVIGSGSSDPNVASLRAVECQSASSCLEIGDDGNNDDGYVDNLPLSGPTGTLSGTVTLPPTKAGAMPGDASGAPVQACSTDGSFCVEDASGTDSSGVYSLAVPVGYSYVVTAFPPADVNDTQALSQPTVPVGTSGISGVDVELAGPPALVGGVTVDSQDFGTEGSETAVPTVNWQHPFDVHISASAFPSGEVTTVETLVIKGTNFFTGQPESETVYAGGKTTTASGQSAANGLVVGPAGVDIVVPALAPIHGPVSMAVRSFSVPVSAAPTGVGLAGTGPVKFSQAALSNQVTIIATDFDVDHTVGTPTITGADASTFALSAPQTCAPQPTIVQPSAANPDADQSCSLGVTWTPPAAADQSKGTYDATMSVPVTNSSGEPATLRLDLLACDDRVSTGSCPSESGETTTLGGLYVDPSGTVETTTADGATVPLDGATVTLSQENSDGSYSTVANGSDVMSPANRMNPLTTGEDGGFGWDTLAGTYEITASDSACSNTATSAPETVPPPALNIDLMLDCPGISQSASSTTVGADPTTVAPGQTVDLTATVSGNSPTGTVAFAYGSTTLATVPVDASTGEASYATAGLPPGQDTVTATYSGDASNAISTGQERLTVQGAPSVATATAAGAAPSSSASRASVSYSATITPASGSADPTGTVVFTAEAGGTTTALCTATVEGATAMCSAASAPVGRDSITAAYGGDTNFAASSGATTETVTALGTATAPPGTSTATAPPGTSTGTTSPPATRAVPSSCRASAGHPIVAATTVKILITEPPGTGSCTITVALTIQEKRRDGKLIALAAAAKPSRKLTTTTVPVGSATVTITAGRAKKVRIALNAAGRRLLVAHHKLKAKLAVEHSGTVSYRSTVAFTLAKQRVKKSHARSVG
jgi:hypothetical protein